MSPSSQGEFRRGWGTLSASFAGLAFSVATLAISYTIGVFVDPLREEFGWSRAQIYVANTIVSLVVGVLSLAVGWLTDRVNVRRLIIWSQFAFGLAFFAMAAGISDLTSFYLLYFLLALVGVATIAVPFAKIITAEFVKNRGLALGLAMSGSGLCGLMVPPYTAYVVEHFGWRAGYAAVGLLPLLIALPLAVAFLHDPARASEPGPSPGARRVVGTADDATFAQALTGYRFWVLFIVFTLGSCVMTALITNFVPILADQGYSSTQAATMAGSFGVTVIAGRVVVGYLIDRLWAPLVGCIIFLPAALAIFLLAGGNLGTTALLGTILMSGFAAGAEVDLMGYLASRYFGLRHFGKIFAGVYIGFALGPGATTPLFGAARDQLGSYQLGLQVAAAALTFAALLLLTLGAYPRPRLPRD